MTPSILRKSLPLAAWPALCVAVLALQGCDVVAPIGSNAVLSDQVIAEKTANYFSSTEAHVQVFGFDRQRESTRYQASFQGNKYNCSIYMNQVRCDPAAQ
ncbi:MULTISPECIES: hypothetical protein [Comamonas]|jgi:hypothetical protein|uniref:Lipoprotein n=1 Tax=Comamonas squillarum TaxID=2977320 RepID=A0ABY5ZVG4_9BURK|nr:MULTISPECIES: hypothetical protein [Comamonas]PWB19156.1 hypothetical protein DCO45_08075 [Comamonas sp. JNW]UXC17319.1 hypothetical protein N4T19_16620 [Comamonas sp. PR12]